MKFIAPWTALVLFVHLTLASSSRSLAGEGKRARSAPRQEKAGAPRCPGFEHFLEQVNSEARPEAKSALVEKFLACAREQGLPLIEGETRPGFGRATFLYRGPAARVVLAGDMTGTVPGEALTRIPGTDLFFLSREFELDARLDYKFVLNDKDWVLDPLNPRTMVSGFGPNSQFWMPDYVAPREIEFDPGIPHGTIEDLSFPSTVLKNSRNVKVYLPPAYPEPAVRYRVLYVHDGTDYLKFAKINNVVDYLIHKRAIPPLLLVMVPPLDRNTEYLANAEFAKAFSTELVALVDARYHTDPTPRSRAMLGASLGGLAAAFIALTYPHVFGNFAGQSSAFLSDAPLELIRTSPKRDIRIHLDVGTYESNLHGLDLLTANRRFRDALIAKGYPLQYLEVHEGHSWGSWRARIATALEFLWGTQPSGCPQ